MIEILCIEAGQYFETLLRRALPAASVVVLAGHSSDAALRLIDINHPNAIIVDGDAFLALTGPRLLTALRTLTSRPIVLLATNPAPPIRQAYERAGYTAFAAKPVIVRSFLSIVKGVLSLDETHLVFPPTPLPYRIGYISFMPREHVLVAHGKRIELVPPLSHILEILCLHRGYPLSAKDLAACIWGVRAYRMDTSFLDEHIRALESAFAALPGHPQPIETGASGAYVLADVRDEEKEIDRHRDR